MKLLLAGEIWPQWRDLANVDAGRKGKRGHKSNSFKKEIVDAGNLLPDTSHCSTSHKLFRVMPFEMHFLSKTEKNLSNFFDGIRKDVLICF